MTLETARPISPQSASDAAAAGESSARKSASSLPTSEEDPRFQKFMSFINNSDSAHHTDERGLKNLEGFDLTSLLARGQPEQQTIAYSTKAAPAASMVPQPSPTSNGPDKGTAAYGRELTAALAASKPIWKPTEKLKADQPSQQVQNNHQEGENKALDAKAKMAEFKDHVFKTAEKSGQTEQAAPKDPSAPTFSGAIARELTIGTALGMVNPALGAAYTVSSAMRAMQGQGSLVTATEQGPSAFTRTTTDRRGRQTESAFRSQSYGYDAAQPTVSAAPQPSADTRQAAADLQARTQGAGDMLGGITKLSLENKINQSEPMRQYQSQMVDANAVLKIHEQMEHKGLEVAGKSTLKPEDLEPAKQSPKLATLVMQV